MSSQVKTLSIGVTDQRIAWARAPLPHGDVHFRTRERARTGAPYTILRPSTSLKKGVAPSITAK